MECGSTIAQWFIRNMAVDIIDECGCIAWVSIYKNFNINSIQSYASLVLSIIIIALMHWLTHLISWLICIFVVIASISITVILWMTYYNIKHDLDMKDAHSLLQEFVRNETAIYVLAIIATIVMVRSNDNFLFAKVALKSLLFRCSLSSSFFFYVLN